MKPMMARYEHWNNEYRRRRYCEHLSKEELDERISNIVLNLIRLTPQAKIGLQEIGAEGGRWMMLFAHVQEEMHLRHGKYPAGFSKDIFKNNPLPDFVNQLAGKAASVIGERKLEKGNFLIKYGSEKYMAHLLYEGIIRIQSASYYKSPEHNGAVCDDEMSLSISLRLSREDVVGVVKNPESVPDDLSSQRFDFSHLHKHDFWLYCLTEAIEARHFVDFDATSCVIIKDRNAFQQRISAAMKECQPSTHFCSGQAQYVDPLLPNEALLDVPLSKHFKYSYQNEFRMIWKPNTPSEALNHVDLKLGPITDIAELIVL